MEKRNKGRRDKNYETRIMRTTSSKELHLEKFPLKRKKETKPKAARWGGG